jgi:hypothetical protein
LDDEPANSAVPGFVLSSVQKLGKALALLDAELLEDAVEVGLDGADGDHQSLGDLGV